MGLQVKFLLLVLLGCLCNGQVVPRDPLAQLFSNQELLMQPVNQAQQGLSSLPTNLVYQGGLSVQEDPRQNFLQFLPERWMGQPSGAMPVLQSSQEQPSSQLSLALQPPQRQPTAQLSPVFQSSQELPSLQVPQRQYSAKSQFLATSSGVKVECREDSVLVEVQQDMLGTGQLIHPSEITLGGCAPSGQEPSTGVIIFVSELQGCGSTLMMADSLIYRFVLVYVPKGIGSVPIVRSSGAVINIECHYLRRYNVSSSAVIPTWVPYSAALSAEERLVFSLILMTGDWQLERTSNVYFLGDVLNIVASVFVANHQPLRVFVDSCVATLSPDVTSVPRYAFVENYGCLTDAKLVGSHSQFLPRKQDDKLQMQIGAFRFSQEMSSTVYITCILKATMASKTTDAQHKACSYSVASNGWTAADGNEQVCSCCDGSCNFRKGRTIPDFKGKATVGPIVIWNKHPVEQVPSVQKAS